MGYFLREIDPGSYQHVWNRGVRRTDIYRTDRDRRVFQDELRRASEATGVEVVAYCQMGNHFHLVLRSPEGGLSEMMQRVQSSYARRHNAAHGHDGPLFRSRFQSHRIADEPQLLATSRYVHRNPLELGVRIDDYPWSSYPDYLGARRTSWIRPELLLDIAGGAAEYRRFVEQPLPSDRFAVSDGVRTVAAPTVDPDLQVVWSVVAADAERGDLPRRWLRSSVFLVAVDFVGATADEIATQFGVTTTGAVHAAVSRARKRLVGDEHYAAFIRRCASSISAAAA